MNVRKQEPKPSASSASYSWGTHVVQLLQDSKTYTCNLLLLTCQLCSLHSFLHPSLTYENQDRGWAADITPYIQLTGNCWQTTPADKSYLMKCCLNQISNNTSSEKYAVFTIPRSDLSLLSLLSLRFRDEQLHTVMRLQYFECEYSLPYELNNCIKSTPARADVLLSSVKCKKTF